MADRDTTNELGAERWHDPTAPDRRRTARPLAVVLAGVIVVAVVAATLTAVVVARRPTRIAQAKVTAITTETGTFCLMADDRPWISTRTVVAPNGPMTQVPGTFDQTGDDDDGTFSWNGSSTPVHTTVAADAHWKEVVCAIR